MENKIKIENILLRFKVGQKTLDESTEAICDLFNVSNSVCKHVWNLQSDTDGKFRCVDCGYESPIKTDY